MLRLRFLTFRRSRSPPRRLLSRLRPSEFCQLVKGTRGRAGEPGSGRPLLALALPPASQTPHHDVPAEQEEWGPRAAAGLWVVRCRAHRRGLGADLLPRMTPAAAFSRRRGHPQGRTAAGMAAIRLADGSRLLGSAWVDPDREPC